jgi:signal peptidase I
VKAKAVEVEDATPATLGRRAWTWIKEILIIVVSALVLSFLLKTFFFQSFWIPSSSMEGTLAVGDRILVTKWRPGPLELRHGDIVVFRDPNNWLSAEEVQAGSGPQGVLGDVLKFTGLLPDDAGEHLVKRVVGLPGDTVECRTDDGPVYVNGVAITETYLSPGVAPCTGFATPWKTEVPADYVWVMGDNRGNSADSRAHPGDPGGGSIPIDHVVGTAFATVWPLDHWKGLGNPFPAAAAPTPGAAPTSGAAG